MYTKTAARNAGGPVSNPPSTDFLDIQVALNVASGTYIPKGLVLCADMSQLDATPYFYAAPPFGLSYSPTIEVVVPTYAANAGRVIGVYQGPGFATTTAALQTTITVRAYGKGVVMGNATGANLLINSNLVTIPWTGPLTTVGSGYGVKPAAFAVGNQVGIAPAFFINTGVPVAITGGGASQAVQVSPAALANGTLSQLQNNTGMYGITAAIAPSLVIDSLASGIQETVTVTGVTAGAAATQTFTVGGTVTAAAVLTATINGVAATYTTVSGDTATTAAVSLANAINASAAVSGAGAVIQPVTNVAGVITVVALTTGTVYNAVTTVAAISNAGTTTFVAGGATLASGTNSTFTAVFANAHAGTAGAPIPVQGAVKQIGTGTPASTQTVLAASGFLAQTLIPCNINCQ